MRFTIEDIARQFDPGTFARGQAYANDGRVAAVSRNGERIEGEVHGSGRSVYRQSIRLGTGRAGIQFKGDCSCPISYNCKHVVATLLASLAVRDADSEDDQDSLSFDAEQWLQLLATVQEAASAPAAAPDPYARMVYVLMPDAQGDTLELYACKAKLRKDGSIASAAIHSDLHGLLYQRPAFLGPADEEPLRLLAALRTGAMHGEGTRPVGRFGARLLSLLCAEGRLWLGQGRVDLRRGALYRVAAGPLRHAALAWREDDDGDDIALTWQFDTGERIGAVLATDPPCYLDEAVLGELALPPALGAIPPPLLVQLVTRAPVIDVEERAGMAARLAALGLDRIVPVPKALAFRERADVVPVPHLLLDHAARKVRGTYFYIDYAQLTFDYDGVSTAGMDDSEGVLRRVVGDAVEIIVRDDPAEVAALETLRGIGFTGFGDDAVMLDLGDALALPTPAAWLAFVRNGITLAGNDITSGVLAGTREGLYGHATITNGAGGIIRGQSDSAIVAEGAASGFTVTINNNAGATLLGGGAATAAIRTGADRTVIVNAGVIDGSSSGKAIQLGSAAGNSLIISGGNARVLGSIDGGTGGRNTMTVDAGAGNRFAYAGTISNFASVEFRSGTTTLSGKSTYTGDTIVSGGTLALAGSNLISAESALVLAGGTLDLGGNQTFASLSLLDDSAIDFGGGALTFNGIGNIAAGKNLVLSDADSGNVLLRFLGDTMNDINFQELMRRTSIDHIAVTYRFDGTYTNVFGASEVPEPGSIALVLGGVGLLGALRRRRRTAGAV